MKVKLRKVKKGSRVYLSTDIFQDTLNTIDYM